MKESTRRLSRDTRINNSNQCSENFKIKSRFGEIIRGSNTKVNEHVFTVEIQGT